MSIVILNWSGNENESVASTSRIHKNAFEAQGRTVRVLNLDDQFLSELLKEQKGDIEFAFLWQGEDSCVPSISSLLPQVWEKAGVPLLYYHTDHPSVRPDLHNTSSSWIRHVYFAQSFATFATDYLSRKEQAQYLELPSLYPTLNIKTFVGDYFVLPRHLEENSNIYQSWSTAPQSHLVELLGIADGHITKEFLFGNQRNLHEVIDALLTPEALINVRQDFKDESDATIRLVIHHLLHPIYRNLVSEYIISELADMPIKIYGRGWDRLKAKNNPKHQFYEGMSFDASAFQYWSNYGILDVAPVNDCLHDKTLRAMSFDAGFLTASNWTHQTQFSQGFSTLFFDGTEGDLRSKAEQIVRSPSAHREQCREFAELHRTQFTIANFLTQLDGLADSVRNKHQPV